MLPGGGDAAYRNVLTAGGQYTTRVDVWGVGASTPETFIGGAGADTVPERYRLTRGEVSATLESRVARRLSIDVDASWFPLRSPGLFDPLGTVVSVRAGWRAGSREWWWPVFSGPVVEVRWETTSALTRVEAQDWAEPVVADDFLVPRSSGAGAKVTTRIMDLVTDTLPGAEFVEVDLSQETVPELTWESDRAGALDKLAESIGCLWYPVPATTTIPTFTIRRVPWQADPVPPVVSVGPGAGLLRADLGYGREGVVNAVVVSGEAATGDEPVSAVLLDEDPLSRTYARGPLGRRVGRIGNDTVTSAGQAWQLARDTLRSNPGVGMRVESADLVADPSLELGDTVRLSFPGCSGCVDRILSGFSLPLARGPIMATSWRIPGEVDDG